MPVLAITVASWWCGCGFPVVAKLRLVWSWSLGRAKTPTSDVRHAKVGSAISLYLWNPWTENAALADCTR
ncbi:hypothetical protein IAQ61_002335 [Plenodomus lingam]|uniref:Predicted protein n=1 Tax=Leptosphaeria maculans (strain JN3 / isolate v23.1.3 / race Av1-4-5-6-7-8) TaxID=985895 RepID=E4ZHM9_LEPMJ|nr:predicted protein [Plenodomus lingam JN3]KAH9876974.1 hypothetical protein IAQ61_002335 [Plenodomus lingam]CBX90862.1 predicted protein [Plenodomus lingam JN3]